MIENDEGVKICVRMISNNVQHRPDFLPIFIHVFPNVFLHYACRPFQIHFKSLFIKLFLKNGALETLLI